MALLWRYERKIWYLFTEKNYSKNCPPVFWPSNSASFYLKQFGPYSIAKTGDHFFGNTKQLFINLSLFVRRLLYTGVFFLLILSCQRDTERRSDYLIQGIDVSRYQLQINWPEVAQQDVHFAFVKATEGATHLDTLFHKNWQLIQDAGIRKGAYHFFRPRTDAYQQAIFFIGQVELRNGDLPPVLDIEVLDGTDPRELLPALHTWLRTVRDYYGIRPVLYTNLKFYNRYLAGHFDDYPLWIARYSEEKPVLACGREWQFWQYGNRGHLPGIEGHVDFNVFYGDWLAFDSLTYSRDTALSSSRH